MAKSRSESILRGAFPLLSLRGAEIPRFTRNKLRNVNGFAKGNRMMPGPGKMLLRGAEIPRFTRNKLRNLEKGSLK